jgi:hypothetical protein
MLAHYLRSGAEARLFKLHLAAAGAQLTSFTGTKVRILTQKEMW